MKRRITSFVADSDLFNQEVKAAEERCEEMVRRKEEEIREAKEGLAKQLSAAEQALRDNELRAEQVDRVCCLPILTRTFNPRFRPFSSTSTSRSSLPSPSSRCRTQTPHPQ